MTHTATATVDASPLVLRTTWTAPQQHARTSPPTSWQALSRGLADVVGVIGVVYLFPIPILAIGIPIALAINGLLLAAEWMWRTLG
jgi:hypothetical protein